MSPREITKILTRIESHLRHVDELVGRLRDAIEDQAHPPAPPRPARSDDHGARGPLPVKRQPAEEWLRGRLADGAKPLADLVAEGDRLGFTRGTIHRALKHLGAACTPDHMGRKVFSLP